MRIKIAGAIMLGLLGFAVLATTPAQAADHQPTATTKTDAKTDAAQPFDAVETFKNENTLRCIDDSVSYGLRSFGCNGLSYQQFNVHVWNDGTRELKNLNTGRCVDDSGTYGLRAYPCNSSTYQSWWILRFSDGSIGFQNQNTGRCIDDSLSYGLRSFGCNSLSYQRWV